MNLDYKKLFKDLLWYITYTLLDCCLFLILPYGVFILYQHNITWLARVLYVLSMLWLFLLMLLNFSGNSLSKYLLERIKDWLINNYSKS